MKATPAAELAELVCPFLQQTGLPVPADRAWLTRAVDDPARAREDAGRAGRVRSASTSSTTSSSNPKAAATHLKPEIAPALVDLTHRLETVAPWEATTIEAAFHDTIATHAIALGKLAQPVRVAVTGGTASPGIFEVLDVLGRDRTIARLRAALRGSGPPPRRHRLDYPEPLHYRPRVLEESANW